MTVDLPVPFSPTKNVTGDVNSMSRPRTMGRLNGYSSDSTTGSFRLTRTRYGGGEAVNRSSSQKAGDEHDDAEGAGGLPGELDALAKEQRRQTEHGGGGHQEAQVQV